MTRSAQETTQAGATRSHPRRSVAHWPQSLSGSRHELPHPSQFPACVCSRSIQIDVIFLVSASTNPQHKTNQTKKKNRTDEICEPTHLLCGEHVGLLDIVTRCRHPIGTGQE